MPIETAAGGETCGCDPETFRQGVCFSGHGMKKIGRQISVLRKFGMGKGARGDRQWKKVGFRPIRSVRMVQKDKKKQAVPATARALNTENRTVNVMDNEVMTMEQSTVAKTQTTGRGRYSNTAAVNTARVERSEGVSTVSSAARKAGRDLQSGLELLDLDFLLGVVENTSALEDQDVTMRKLSFTELVRTNRVHEIDSNALKAYALDQDAHFGKEIQVEAFKELAERTSSNAGK
ncbi:MAG: hypothetical protein JXA82_06235 [Sedimentisphaerales bacterium]|nr:hypothetical protein [Sedimentisphaerales bacterium]